MNVKNDLLIRHAVLIRSDVEQVYDALTTAEGLDSWFTKGAQVDPRPGGAIRFRWVDWGPDHFSGEDGGPVLEADRPRRFVFQWRPDEPSYATTVEIDLEAGNDGTVIRLLEFGYHDTPNGRSACLECAAGWGEALTLLKFYVEHGIRY